MSKVLKEKEGDRKRHLDKNQREKKKTFHVEESKWGRYIDSREREMEGIQVQ
jgi:hypothetical protein